MDDNDKKSEDFITPLILTKEINTQPNNNIEILKIKNLIKLKYLNNMKNLPWNNKNYLNDLINFQIYRSKKIDKKLLKLKEFFSHQLPPKFNVKAKFLMEKFNLKEGKELGQKIKEIEIAWINNSFKITDKQIEKIING